MQHEFKEGQKVRVNTPPDGDSFYGHFPGDIGIIKEVTESAVHVVVEGRISTSVYRPAVSHNKKYVEAINASEVVDNYQIY